MATSFDPYYKWLGIAPKHQPPHHYRLLGLDPFEPDHEVIDAAANRLMAYLQDLASGEHAEASQRLLNEVSAARLCLLDPASKSEYDHRLRAELESKKAAEKPPPTPPPPPKSRNRPIAAPPPPPVARTGDTAGARRRDSGTFPGVFDDASRGKPVDSTDQELPFPEPDRTNSVPDEMLPAIEEASGARPGRGDRKATVRARQSAGQGAGAGSPEEPSAPARVSMKPYAIAAAGLVLFGGAVAVGLLVASSDSGPENGEPATAARANAASKMPAKAGGNEAAKQQADLGGILNADGPRADHPRLRAWLSADEGVWGDAEKTKAAGPNGAVAYWVDQSAQGFELAQSDTARRPRLVGFGPGLRGVRFEAGDVLAAPGRLLENRGPGARPEFTVLMVMRLAGTGAGSAANDSPRRVFAQTGADGQTSEAIAFKGKRLHAGDCAVGQGEVDDVARVLPGHVHLVTWIRTRDEQWLFIDGASAGNDDAPPSAPSWQPEAWALGDPESPSGGPGKPPFVLAELLVYDDDLSPIEQQSVESYLRRKYPQIGDDEAIHREPVASKSPSDERPEAAAQPAGGATGDAPKPPAGDSAQTAPPDKPKPASPKTKPAEAAKPPAKPSKPEPEPPKQLAALPPALELPNLDNPEARKTTVRFGPLGLPDPGAIKIKLTGGDNVLGQLSRFELAEREQPDDGPGAQWEFRAVDDNTATAVPVAKLWIENDHLAFRWLEAAPEQQAERLCNCRLELWAPAARRHVLLRKPVVVDPLPIGELEQVTFDVPAVPPPRGLRLELLELTGPVKGTGFVPESMIKCSRNTNIQLVNQDPVEPMFVRVTFVCSTTEGLKAEVQLMVRSGRRSMRFDLERAKHELDALNQELKAGQGRFDGLMKQAGKNEGLRGKLAKEFDNWRGPRVARADTLKKYIPRATALMKSGKIHFRIFAIVGGYDITLVTSKK